MLVDVRPTSRLRGEHPIDVTAALRPIVDALCEDSFDLSRLRVVCDWIQYRHNFRPVVDVRAILGRNDGGGEVEVAVDLRRRRRAGPRGAGSGGVRPPPRRRRR